MDAQKINALNTYSGFILNGFNPSEGSVEKSAGYASLLTPVKDAEAMMAILIRSYGFEPVRPDLSGSILMISGGDVEPTRANIVSRLNHVMEKELTEKDSILIYFAGHGDGKKTDFFGKWIPADGDSKSRFIEHTYIHEFRLGESKWHKKPIGPEPVKHLIRQGEIIKEREGKYLKTLRLWLFSYQGVTINAEVLMREHGVLWSVPNDLNRLLEPAGLRNLPEFD